MKTEIINGVPTEVPETLEEATGFTEKDAEIFQIVERIEDIERELESAKDAYADSLCEPERESEHARAAEWIKDLKKERKELRERLRALNT